MALSKVNPNLITQGASGRKNLFINGGFDVWQRGTSLAGATSYLADRWFNGTTETQSRQAFTVGQTEVGGNPTYYHRGSSGSTEWYGLKQRIENVGTTAGREVTLSYWAKGSSAFTNAPYRGQNFGSGGSSDVNAALSTANITTSWARYTHTFTLPSISGKTVGAGSYIQINLIRANVNNITIDLANCQLELGSVATDFEHRSYGEELRLCQRYFYRYKGATQERIYNENAGATAKWWFLTFPEMRTTPTATFSPGWTSSSSIVVIGGTISSMTVGGGSSTAMSFRVTNSGSGGTVKALYHTDSFSQDYCYLSAEL
jgi:hypothetical protein